MATAIDVHVLQPSADVSPYSFIEFLNRGAYQTMYTYDAGVATDGFTHNHETFISFDLPPGLLDPGEVVIQASLIMVYAFSFSHDPMGDPPAEVPMTLEVREVLASWDEMTLNWANMPAASATTVDTEPNVGFDDYGPIELDVTSLVQEWADGTKSNYGFKLTNPDPRPMGFWTKEAFIEFAAAGNPLEEELRSVLVVVVGDPSAVPAMSPPIWAAMATIFAGAGSWTLRRRRGGLA